MKKFTDPQINIRELSSSESIMDDITLSAEQPFTGSEEIVDDKTEDAIW